MFILPYYGIIDISLNDKHNFGSFPRLFRRIYKDMSSIFKLF